MDILGACELYNGLYKFLPALKVRNAIFATIYIYNASFCQDRLGTNIRKT
eukprot:COSAG06_NODE_9475_length_1890_cov_2.218314_1_plen_49_part_10